ncbi:MAG: primase-helicase family protein [Pseudomonadota bacterium]
MDTNQIASPTTTEASEPSLPIKSVHTTEILNDATVFGDLSSPESQAVLSSELITGFSPRAPKVAGDKWLQRRFPFGSYLEALTQHPVQSTKEGSAFFPNETELTGRAITVNGEKQLYTHRAKAKAKSVTAFVIDIDGTDHIDRVRDRLIELGLFGILYTTHSHAKKVSPNGDYFRVIVPMDRPFLVSEFGGTVQQASKNWTARYAGFAKHLGIEELDLSAAKFVQMMYLPRRATENAQFKHYVVAGRALTIPEMPIAHDLPEFKHRGFREQVSGRVAAATSQRAILADGFDVREWFNDCGSAFDLELFLEMIGWDIRNPAAGDGMTIMCPNHLEHSEPDDGTDSGGWCCATDGEKPFVMFCHHAHCAELRTWDFIRLLEDRLADGDAALPDEFSSLSEMLCDELFYPEIGGECLEVHPSQYGAKPTVEIGYLSTPKKVEDAFQALVDDQNAGDREFAAVFAGIAKAGNKAGAVKRLNELLTKDGRYNNREVASLKSQAKTILSDMKAETAALEKERIQKEAMDALSMEDDASHPSWDIAASLGDTMQEAIATLNKRWRVVSVGGKVRLVRVPDPTKLLSQSVAIESMSKPDFEMYHADRCILVEDKWVNPAKVFVNIAQRFSAIEFNPPPLVVGENAYNLYRGRQLKQRKGDCLTLKKFIRHTVCRDREDLFRFVWLYLAHLVQRPGEKAHTAIVLRGLGGCGKSTFGMLLERLVAPYSLTIAEEEHVTGRFAGQHLCTALVAVCTEALFAGDPKINGKIKSLVTSDTIMVEPKGLPVVVMPSFTRFFFDSNNERVVPIDGNGSERRYLVMEINDSHKDDHTYFDEVYEQLNGDGVEALLWELENYVPSDDGLSWGDLRTAPDTPERRKMRWHSMRPVERAIIRMIEDGSVTMKTESGQTFRYSFEVGKPIRLPQSELRRFLGPSMNRFEAKDGDIGTMMNELLGETITANDGTEHVTVKMPRGVIECEEFVPGQDAAGDEWEPVKRSKVRCFEFPPVEVLQACLKERYQRVGVDDG